MFDEFGAQLNLTKKQKRKENHTCKHVLMPDHVMGMTAICLSSTVEKRRRLLSQLSDYAQLFKKWRFPGTAGRNLTPRPTSKGDDPRHSGQRFNTSTDKVKMEEKANCFTLLKRITGLKCVNSEIKSNVESCCLARHSPKGSYHLVEPAGRTHLYRKANRICDLECIEHANQQKKWNPVKKLDLNAAVKFENP